MRKLLSSFLLVLLMLSPFTNLALAAPDTQADLTQAIGIAKSFFDISNDMDDLTSRYQIIEDHPYWELYWKSSTINKTIRMTVDMKRHEVMAYHSYNYTPSEANSYLPKLNRAEAKDIALAKILELAHFNQDELLDVSYNESIPLHQGEKYYYFTFAQQVNDIPYYDNQIDVTIDADSGELKSYGKKWTYGLTFPQNITINTDRAAELFEEQAGLQLTYLKTTAKDDSTKLILVYQARYASQFMIDAQTGALIESPKDIMRYNKQMASEDSVVGFGEQSLSPYEIEEVTKYAELLSQTKALQLVSQNINIPDNFVLSSANITRDYAQQDHFLWTFSFENSAQESESSFRKQSNLSVAIDAKNGKLISFSHYIYHDQTPASVDYKIQTTEEAQTLAEAFISKYYPQLINEVCLEKPLGYTDDLTAQESYHFHYDRRIKSADYTRHGFNVYVDAIDGRVASFNIAWDNLDFPTQEQRLDVDEMMASYLCQNPLRLQYVNLADYDQPQDIHLAYVIEETIPYYQANTGVAIDHQGNPIEKEKSVTYTDITGHWIEEAVTLLQPFELLPFEGDRLLPAQAMTCQEWVEMLYRIRHNYTPRPIDPAVLEAFATDYQLYPTDLDTFKTDEPLTRQDMAQILVNYMGYQSLSTLSIYVVPFKDALDIAPNRLGAVAICYGLNLMNGYNHQIQPNHVATRAEAISTLVRFLS